MAIGRHEQSFDKEKTVFEVISFFFFKILSLYLREISLEILYWARLPKIFHSRGVVEQLKLHKRLCVSQKEKLFYDCIFPALL